MAKAILAAAMVIFGVLAVDYVASEIVSPAIAGLEGQIDRLGEVSSGR